MFVFDYNLGCKAMTRSRLKSAFLEMVYLIFKKKAIYTVYRVLR